MLDSNDDMDGDNEIPLEIPDGFELAQAPLDESSRRRTPWLMHSPGVKLFTTGLQLVGLKEKF